MFIRLLFWIIQKFVCFELAQRVLRNWIECEKKPDSPFWLIHIHISQFLMTQIGIEIWSNEKHQQ